VGEEAQTTLMSHRATKRDILTKGEPRRHIEGERKKAKGESDGGRASEDKDTKETLL